MTEPTTSYLRTRHSRARLATPSMPSNACSIPAGCTKLMANSESPMQRHNEPTSAQFLLSFLFPEMGAEPLHSGWCTVPIQQSSLCVPRPRIESDSARGGLLPPYRSACSLRRRRYLNMLMYHISPTIREYTGT